MKMSKRRGIFPCGSRPSKTPRNKDVDDGNTGDLEQDPEDPGESSPPSTSTAGDIGIIESITLMNFMCHHSPKTLHFGPNVNFIVGNNGSGKSAVLTALIVGLGGKAIVTNRGQSLKGFVTNGERYADIKIQLRNRGTDAYKRDDYGNSITVEQRLTSDGCRTYKIRSEIGQIVSSKKEELTNILDHFSIQIDNPVSVLNQEMSKQFLYSKSEADKYKFFMKATLLEQMKLDYIHIKQTKELTRDRVGTQEKYLRDLRKKYLQKKERYDSLSSLDEMKKKLEDLQHEMAWSLVAEQERQIQQLQEQIENAECSNPYEDNIKVSQAQRKCQEIQQKLDTVKGKEENLEEERRKLREDLTTKSKAQKEQEEKIQTLRERLEEKNIQASVESKQRRKSQLMASRSNRLRRFGNQFPELLMAIDNAHAEGRFLKKPIGPVGACISLKDPSLAVAVESCLRNFTKTFCCHSHKDEKVLEALMSRYFPRIYRPGIIVMPFADQVYNTAGRCVKHPEFPSVLDALVIPSPVIANCLIDMRSIETVLVIKDRVTARRVMQQGKPPRNCREAFTSEGDQVFADRYYSAESSMAKYLGADVEAEIRLVDSELENATAQLSRFHAHINSVTQNIHHMEVELQSLMVRSKKNQACITQVKATIVELENTEELQRDDISSLEDEAQENLQKAEAVKHSLREAEEELDRLKALMTETHSKHKEMKSEIEKLQEQAGSLPEEFHSAEAECNTLECTLNKWEMEQREHEENLQAMRSELISKKEEVQELETTARLICSERRPVERSIESVNAEMTCFRQRILEQQSQHGDQEQIIREYAEALKSYQEAANQVKDLKRFIDCLDNIMNDRLMRFKMMRRSIAVRCKLYFSNFLIKLNCSGSMIFDHTKETLSISLNEEVGSEQAAAVKPPGCEDDSVNDVRSLSGGERSFATVCFILALWEITESPFRCLDEFDVYMDMHNRRISMDLLVQLSERQYGRQFIFITPQHTRACSYSFSKKLYY
ncbi:structural maintenance of chromosomes protein 6-like [Scleropages formosus]|uniref:Structural maintenance of chromosomes protein 6 n=1 Tax=Scleropages formosus TaxID=113540 RepID=A0A0P7VTJ2_SCLFO|nr:structural maintenance of chromosomes protein 6-like [Scleropages formosus]